MAKLKVLPSRLSSLPPVLSYMDVPARSSGASRAFFSPWRRWYSSTRWRALRMKILTRDLFACQMCKRIVADTSKLVADHKKPHRGDEVLFWDENNLQALCKPCHDKAKQRSERAGDV